MNFHNLTCVFPDQAGKVGVVWPPVPSWASLSEKFAGNLRRAGGVVKGVRVLQGPETGVKLPDSASESTLFCVRE